MPKYPEPTGEPRTYLETMLSMTTDALLGGISLETYILNLVTISGMFAELVEKLMLKPPKSLAQDAARVALAPTATPRLGHARPKFGVSEPVAPAAEAVGAAITSTRLQKFARDYAGEADVPALFAALARLMKSIGVVVEEKQEKQN